MILAERLKMNLNRRLVADRAQEIRTKRDEMHDFQIAACGFQGVIEIGFLASGWICHRFADLSRLEEPG